MKAMLLDQPNQINLETLDDPRPQEGQVLIKMTHAGICGTDTKIYQGKIKRNRKVFRVNREKSIRLGKWFLG